MDVYLAAAITCNAQVMQGRTDYGRLLLLDSYAYACESLKHYIPKIGKFLLDSGAFETDAQARSEFLSLIKG
jgi:hypothetical protein